MRVRDGLALIGLGVALAGCVAPQQQAAFDGSGPAFAPERFFAGRARFWGVVESVQGGPSAQFAGTLTGRREGEDAVHVDEDLAFADGTKLVRSWRLRRLEGQQVEATGSDIAGVARGEISGRLLHLRYAAAADAPSRASGLDVEHWMYLQDDGVTVLNRTVTRRAGTVIRMTTERLVRAEDRKQASLRDDARRSAYSAAQSRNRAEAASRPQTTGSVSPEAPAAKAGQPEARLASGGKTADDDFWSAFDLRR